MLQILIPAYKAQDFIAHTLMSIRGQKDMPEHEIIIAIDGCEDTLNAVNDIKHHFPTLKVYYCPENKGVYKTINTLLSLADGDNFIIFGADDMMYQNMISEIMKHVDVSDLMQFKYNVLKQSDGKVYKYNEYAAGAIWLNRKTVETLGGFMPWDCSADTEFLKRFRSSGLRLTHIDIQLFIYRRHMGSLTDRIPIEKRLEYHKHIQQWYSPTEVKIIPVINKGEFI